MQNGQIDIDFRRMIAKYWETYLPEGGAVVDLPSPEVRSGPPTAKATD